MLPTGHRKGHWALRSRGKSLGCLQQNWLIEQGMSRMHSTLGYVCVCACVRVHVCVCEVFLAGLACYPQKLAVSAMVTNVGV